MDLKLQTDVSASYLGYAHGAVSSTNILDHPIVVWNDVLGYCARRTSLTAAVAAVLLRMANNPVPLLLSTFVSVDALTVSQHRTVVSCGKLHARDHTTTPRDLLLTSAGTPYLLQMTAALRVLFSSTCLSMVLLLGMVE